MDINDYLTNCATHRIATKTYQNNRNISLSKIYNYFLNVGNFSFIAIFDQDTTINKDFLQILVENLSADIVCPEIFLANKDNVKSSPVYNKSKNNTEFVESGEFNASSIFTCASGLSLSSQLICRVVDKYGFVFDEKYAFYWVDHDFFERLRIFDYVKDICKGHWYHDMSGVGDEYSAMKESAKLEHGYGKVLRRIHDENKSGTIRNIIYAFKYARKANCSLKSTLKILNCGLFRRHPRSAFDIVSSIAATHAYSPILKTHFTSNT